jgi:hypothetical protein
MLTHWTSHIPTPGTQSLQFHNFTSPFITSWCPCCCNEPRNTFIAHSNASQRSLCDQELDWAGYECISQLECVIRNNLSKVFEITHYMKSVYKLFLSKQLRWMPTFCYLPHVLNSSANFLMQYYNTSFERLNLKSLPHAATPAWSEWMSHQSTRTRKARCCVDLMVQLIFSKEFALQVHKPLALCMSIYWHNLTTFTPDYATTTEGNNKYAQNSKYHILDILYFISDFWECG